MGDRVRKKPVELTAHTRRSSLSLANYNTAGKENRVLEFWPEIADAIANKS